MIEERVDQPQVCVVVLNWNSPSLTLGCLEAIQAVDYPNRKLVVVDNGSTDDSIIQIRRRFPTAKLIENSTNLGYAEGNNIGVRYALNAGVDYVLLLNSDVRTASDAISHLVSAGERYPSAAFLGPKTHHMDSPNHIQSAGAQLDYLWRSH